SGRSSAHAGGGCVLWLLLASHGDCQAWQSHPHARGQSQHGRHRSKRRGIFWPGSPHRRSGGPQRRRAATPGNRRLGGARGFTRTSFRHRLLRPARLALRGRPQDSRIKWLPGARSSGCVRQRTEAGRPSLALACAAQWPLRDTDHGGHRVRDARRRGLDVHERVQAPPRRAAASPPTTLACQPSSPGVGGGPDAQPEPDGRCRLRGLGAVRGDDALVAGLKRRHSAREALGRW
ncbi:unnamed protein product, partial [Polarella glacialis]